MCQQSAAVPEALSSFYRKRILRTTVIQFLSRLASDLIINAFDTPWSPHDNKGTNWKSYLTFAWKPLLQYVIFPAQFAYLYSYYPSGSMGDLPAQLEAKWKKSHFESAERAFASAGTGKDSDVGESFLNAAVKEEVAV